MSTLFLLARDDLRALSVLLAVLLARRILCKRTVFRLALLRSRFRLVLGENLSRSSIFSFFVEFLLDRRRGDRSIDRFRFGDGVRLGFRFGFGLGDGDGFRFGLPRGDFASSTCPP